MLHDKCFPCKGSVLCCSQGKESQLTTTSLQWKAGWQWFFQTLVAMEYWKRVKPGDENRNYFSTKSLKMLSVQKWRKLSSRKNSKHLWFLCHVLGCVLSHIQMYVCVHVHAFVFVLVHNMQAAMSTDIPLVLQNCVSLEDFAGKQACLSSCWWRYAYLCTQFCMYIL